MLETNPFKVFCPSRAKYLVLGSFAAKDGKSGVKYNWYYSNGRNQFWPILEAIYDIELKDRTAQQKLFTKLNMAIADIIRKCRRQRNSSLDVHLTDFVYNFRPITRVLKNNPVKTIFFTSRFVEQHYKKHFKKLIEKYPSIELVTLPSPSPRYATITKKEKIKRYKKELPKL